MSKIKLLLDVVSDMRSLADSLQAVCDAMAESESTDADKKPTSEPKKTAKSVNKKIKLEDVRAVLAEKSQAGMTAKVREIIQKYGAAKLSEVDPKHYAHILKDAEGLIDG